MSNVISSITLKWYVLCNFIQNNIYTLYNYFTIFDVLNSKISKGYIYILKTKTNEFGSHGNRNVLQHRTECAQKHAAEGKQY